MTIIIRTIDGRETRLENMTVADQADFLRDWKTRFDIVVSAPMFDRHISTQHIVDITFAK